MLKVMFSINHAGKAGTERYVQSLIEKLHNNKIKAYLLYNEEGLLVERLKSMGVECLQLKMRNPFDLVAAYKLSKICKKHAIDVIHAQYLRENYIALWSKLFINKSKVIYTNHFILENNFILRIFNRFLTFFQAKIIAVCNKGKHMTITNGVNGREIKVIFNGVEPSLWSEVKPSTLREEFNLGKDVFVMLCASRFAYDKGHKFLINSIFELKKLTNIEFKLVLAADGPFLNECKKQVEDLKLENDIIFIGFRKDIKNLIDGSDIYINSSYHEALSFLIIEVLASGLPVIATNMGGNPDIINDQTNCGLLVEYDDAKGLANSILRLMNNKPLQEIFRKNAKQVINEKFSLDIMVKQTYNLYLEVLNNEVS